MVGKRASEIPLDAPEAFISRELSWLAFARRVLALSADPDIPLLERVRFAGIVGMLHDEFFMKRISGLKRQINKKSKKRALDGRTPQEEFEACRDVILDQIHLLEELIEQELKPALTRESLPILEYDQLGKKHRKHLRQYFRKSVLPILTPLAVDAEHPFPFISNLGLNLAILLPANSGKLQRFSRVKVPDNRPRWVPLPEARGYVPLEQVIAANLDLLFEGDPPQSIHAFRVTRGAEGEPDRGADLTEDAALREPGSLVRLVSQDLKARRFAGVVRLEVDKGMPKKVRTWLAAQLEIAPADVYSTSTYLGVNDLMAFKTGNRDDLRYTPHEPVTHPRLSGLDPSDAGAIFHEIRRGDLLLHHPFHSFDSSVVRFLRSAALDPDVLAIKLTIYRTSRGSPIIDALAEAARRGKQVAVLVEITARFDEAPNIAWGQFLEQEGVHVSYGVERLKTHVKLALVVREEQGELRSYLHVGTGNYHTGTARVYEDTGVLTTDPALCDDASAVFNALTGASPHSNYSTMLVAPMTMRHRFTELIQREAKHACEGKPCGIRAKMNQLQDPEIIRELYRAGRAGVPISLNVRGLCCLRPGVPGLSENIRVFSVVGRFLEHSRIYSFVNGGEPEYYIGSADWMKRNLDGRVETIAPVRDERLKLQLAELMDVYEHDNCSAWDCGPDGVYVRRTPIEGDVRHCSQWAFIQMASIEENRP